MTKSEIHMRDIGLLMNLYTVWVLVHRLYQKIMHDCF